MHLRLERWASPISPLLLVTDTKGMLRALEYADYERRMHRLLRRHYGSYTLEEGAAPLSLTQALDAYFAGCIDVLAGVEIATGGTPFQRRVWRALSAIPAGNTVSYGQLASHLGENRASRAVGAANGANPIAIVVPCHRVIGANGGLTGYAGGLLRKQWLLEHEASFSTLANCESVSKTADRSECPRVRSRSIKNRLPAVVPQCRARSQGLERIFPASTGMPG